MARCAASGVWALCTERSVWIPFPRSLSDDIRNMTASTRPQARLHPITPMSIERSSSRPAVAALNVPVNVSAMMTPNRISETRAIGSQHPIPLVRPRSLMCHRARDPSQVRLVEGVLTTTGGRRHCAISHDASGLYCVIFFTSSSVPGPRSFWRATPSWLTMNVMTPVALY